LIHTGTRSLEYRVCDHLAAEHRRKVGSLPWQAQALLSMASLDWHRHRFAPNTDTKVSTYQRLHDDWAVTPTTGCRARSWGHCDYCDHGRAMAVAATFLKDDVVPQSNFTILPKWPREVTELEDIAKTVLRWTSAYRTARPTSRALVPERALLVPSLNRETSALHVHVVTSNDVNRKLIQAFAGHLGVWANFDTKAKGQQRSRSGVQRRAQAPPRAWRRPPVR
jgi:hypothetical protein